MFLITAYSGSSPEVQIQNIEFAFHNNTVLTFTHLGTKLGSVFLFILALLFLQFGVLDSVLGPMVQNWTLIVISDILLIWRKGRKKGKNGTYLFVLFGWVT